MQIIGENIHIISQSVKDALRERDAEFFKTLALKQVEAGAWAVDLNLGPRKKDWEEVLEKCLKEYGIIETALKNMIIAAELQGVMFDKANEKLKELPK